MSLEIKLEAFEGPLDLLLHLIDKNKVDIYDIPIAEIADQYMEYVDQMETDDMDLMSEFLLMAATLLDIKSRLLLPKEVDEEGNEQDPRDELVQKLLEYKMYKYMSEELRERHSFAELSLYRNKNLPGEVSSYTPPVNYEELIGDMTLSGLNAVFQEIIKRQKFRVDPVRSGFGRIEKPAVDITKKELYIKAYLNENRNTSFRRLLEEQSNRDEVVVAFLVILELMKTGKIEVVQDDLFGEITIRTIEAIKTNDESITGEFG